MLDALAQSTPGMKLTQTGIDFCGAEPTKEALDDVLRSAKVVNRCLDWIVGDALIMGLRKGYYGDSYQEAIDLTGMSYQRLANCFHLAKTFEFSRRRENLPVEHHRVVMAVRNPAERERWLDTASEHSLTQRQLRASIDEGRVIPRKEWEQRATRTPSKGVVTLPLLVNRIVSWLERHIEDASPEQKRAWADDLKPVIRLLNRLSDARN